MRTLGTEAGGGDMRKKIMIGQVSLDRIRRLRSNGKAINYIADKYGWPISVIKRICDGVDVEYFQRKPKGINRPKIEGMCNICGTEPRDIPPNTPENEKKWYLFCWRCRPNASDYEVEEYGGRNYTELSI